jgi:formylglycine-generating enzyme required for sulfatase activity
MPHSLRTNRFCLIALVLVTALGTGCKSSEIKERKPAGKSADPLWDGIELVEQYAKRVELAPVMTLDLGDGVKMEFVLIPAGTFVMGSPRGEYGCRDDKRPQREVTICRPFYMSKFETTREQYAKIMKANPSFFWGVKNPVENVSWDDAQEFCGKLGLMTSRTIRLPTEAEWEYACRAGSKTPFHATVGNNDKEEKRHRDMEWVRWLAGNSRVTAWKISKWHAMLGIPMPTIIDMHVAIGPEEPSHYLHSDVKIVLGILDMTVKIHVTASPEKFSEFLELCHRASSEELYLEKIAWYFNNSNKTTHPVGEKKPNAFGLHDMHGNVCEWVEDDWHNNYAGAPTDGRAWVKSPRGIGRVVRGGAWPLGSDSCRSACRAWHSPTLRFAALGFRVVAPLPGEP